MVVVSCLMDTRHVCLRHIIWYGGFSGYGHLVDVPVVHAVGGLSVVDVAELVVLGQVERATTNLRVFPTTIPPGRRRKNISMTSNKVREQKEGKHRRREHHGKHR